MKNKILLTVVFASLGFAIYALFSNLNKAKYQTYYEGTNVMTPIQHNDISWNSTASTTKKKLADKKKSSSSYEKSNSSLSNTSFNTKMMTDDVAVALETNRSEEGTYQPNLQYSRRKSSEINVNYDTGSSVVLLTQARNNKRNSNSTLNNSTTGANLYSTYSTYSSTTQNTFMRAPTDPTNTDGDIIIDPGGDPDPDSMIPIEDGSYIFVILIFAYIIFIAYKKRTWARDVNP